MRPAMCRGRRFGGADATRAKSRRWRPPGPDHYLCQNHRHAEFIQQRFDANYPHLAGHFVRVIDNYQTYAQSLIDDFSKPEAAPHIAISVDMLDTGVDIPEVVNLVFFKLVRSKTKFFQMFGRGTRLRPDLFGPGEDKESFTIFDVCQNFEFFNYNPRGVITRATQPLRQRLFNARLDLVVALTRDQIDDPEHNALITNTVEILHAYVAAMPLNNFLVRPQRKYLDPFLDRQRWNHLRDADVADLTQYVSGLPSQQSDDVETAKRFDLLILQLQLALQAQRPGAVTTLRNRVIETANRLQDKHTIPAVREQLDLIHEVQTDLYWQAITLPRLEALRLSLRDLTRFIEREAQKIIITDFVDELGGIQEASLSYVTGGVNVAQYRQKVEQFLRHHKDHIVIQKIRRARPLTPGDLQELEGFFFAADATGSREAFEQAYGAQEHLGAFIRHLVGLDRRAAKALFNRYLDDKTCTADQIQFVDHIINYLTKNGTMEPKLLYEWPYSDISDNGLDGVFDDGQANRIIRILAEINESAVAKAG